MKLLNSKCFRNADAIIPIKRNNDDVYRKNSILHKSCPQLFFYSPNFFFTKATGENAGIYLAMYIRLYRSFFHDRSKKDPSGKNNGITISDTETIALYTHLYIFSCTETCLKTFEYVIEVNFLDQK